MNIKKIIEEELNKILSEGPPPAEAGEAGEKKPAAAKPRPARPKAAKPQVAKPQAAKPQAEVPPSVTPTEKGFSAQNPFDSVQELQSYYAKPENKKEQQEIAFYKTDKGGIVKAYVADGNIIQTSSAQLKYPSPLDYADQQTLAKQSLTRRFGKECEFATFVQNLIREKIKFDNPILVKKLSDHKMGFVTATAINYMINYATKAGIKTNIKPIAYNKQAYMNACKTDKATMQEFQKLFYAVPPEEIKKVVQQAAATTGTDTAAPAAKVFGTRENPYDSKEAMVWERIPDELKRNGIYYKERGYLKLAKPTPEDPNAFDVQNLGLLPQEQLQESKSIRGMILKEILAALK